MQYYRLCEGLDDIGTLVPVTKSVYDLTVDSKKDYYKSIFIYNEEQKRIAEEMIQTDKGVRRRGISNIIDVITNRLAFDFDKKDNVELAKNDTIELCERLIENGVNPSDLQIAFSGNKGFSVEFLCKEYYTPKEVKNIAFNLASDLSTFDEKVYNPSRIFRIPLTCHNETKLYKFPLDLQELKEYTVEEIKRLAVKVDGINLEGVWSPKSLPRKIMDLKNKSIEAVVKNGVKLEIFKNISDIDWSQKLPFLTPAKYVLHSGHIPPGSRHEAFMILCASYHGVGFDRADTYRLLKAVAERQAKISGQERFSDTEIWGNIIAAVYSPLWKGGQYGTDNPLLMQIESQLPSHVKRAKNYALIENGTVFEKFKKFAMDIEKNTIKFGVSTLDEGFQLITGTSFGILGTPSSGKTTLVLDLLRNNSLAGEQSIFYSLDMNESLIALKQVQRVSGLPNKEIYRIVKENPEKFKELQKLADENYKNVVYSFRGGITPKDIESDIIAYEDKTGKKVRLVVVDYLENVSCVETNDPTTGSGMVAQQLTNIANQLDVLMVILLQTQKSTHPGDQIDSMRQIKGASVIEQALSCAIGISREGHASKWNKDDFSMTVNVIKNRFGQMGTYDVKWNGAKSSIGELTQEDRIRLEDLRQRKKEDKANDGNEAW